MTVADPSPETTDLAATEGDKPVASDTSIPDASAASSTAAKETSEKPAGDKPAGDKAGDAPKHKSAFEAAKAAMAKDKGAAPSAADAKTDQQPKPKTGEVDATAKTDGDDKPEEVPQQFKDHPAWQRIAKARDGFKADAEASKAGADKWKSFNELATAHMGSNEAAAQWLNRGGDLVKAGVTPQEQQVVTEFAIATKSDPNRAFAIIKPIYEALQNIVGDGVLPAELREAVDRGEMTEEAAQRLHKAEASGRIEKRRAEAAGKTVVDTRNAETQRLAGKAMESSVVSWEARVSKNEPDWLRIAPLVNEQVGILREARQPKTPEEAVKLCDDAVAIVKRMVGAGAVARPAVGAAVITPSNRQQEERPKSVLEAVKRGLAR